MELLAHQEQAVDEFLLRGGRLLLHADTGTGKTPTALSCAEEVSPEGPVLYLCPAILKHQVKEEVEKWTEYDAIVVNGSKKQRRGQWTSGKQFYIANYELLLADAGEVTSIPWRMIIADECHKLKNPSSKTYKRFRKLRAPYRLAMSGTPWPNAIWEAWTMADWIKPGIFGENFWRFKKYECILNPWDGIEAVRDDAGFRKKLDTLVHRIRREDAIELPPLVERRLECKMDTTQRAAYETLKKELEIEIQGEKLTVTNVLSMLTRLRQIVDGPEVLGIDCADAKRKLFRELIASIGSRKIIVFAELKTVLRSLQGEFGGLIIDGDTPQSDRASVLQNFKEKEERLLFLSSAGEHGLNIQCADTIIHYSLPWNFARVDQREARAYRYGQERPVTTYRLIVNNSVDEKMERLVEKKKKLNVEDLINAI